MKNQNIHTMKQPDLGKKLAELRKQNGLTQEELVEKCNISVRTIQRIEAGEVEPRSYTVKTILNALNLDFETVFEENYEVSFFDRILGVSLDSNKRIKQLNISWAFGIVYFIIGFFEVGYEYYRSFGDEYLGGSIGIGYVIVKSIALVSFVFFMRGFVIVGGIFNSYLLQIIATLLMVFIVVFGFYDMLTLKSLNSADSLNQFFDISRAVTLGILQVIFGIAILKLNSKIGDLASVTGIFEIIVGVFFMSVIGVAVGLVLLIPTEILEIIIIYKVVKNLKHLSL